MRYSYHRWPDRTAYEAAMAASGWPLGAGAVPDAPDVAAAVLADEAGWHMILAGAAPPPAALVEAARDAAEAPLWWAGVPRDTVPADPPVPAEVTNFQARAVMRARILPDGRSLETVVREALWQAREAAGALPESHPARMQADQAWLAWEQSNVFLRHGALVSSMSAALGLAPAEVDELFRLATTIEA